MLPADFAFLLFYNSELLRNHAILKMQEGVKFSVSMGKILL